MHYSVNYSSVQSLISFVRIVGRTLSILGKEAVTSVKQRSHGTKAHSSRNGGNSLGKRPRVVFYGVKGGEAWPCMYRKNSFDIDCLFSPRVGEMIQVCILVAW